MSLTQNAVAGPFAPVLQRLGFKRIFRCRDCIEYQRVERNRRIEVQIWADGRHRASNSIDHKPPKEWWYATTLPTGFGTPDEMEIAISIEAMRTDHKP